MKIYLAAIAKLDPMIVAFTNLKLILYYDVNVPNEFRVCISEAWGQRSASTYSISFADINSYHPTIHYLYYIWEGFT